jgi:hypothetical protein
MMLIMDLVFFAKNSGESRIGRIGISNHAIFFSLCGNNLFILVLKLDHFPIFFRDLFFYGYTRGPLKTF